MDNEKSLLKSSRFWTGIIAFLTLISMLFTGEKTIQEQLPLIVASGFALLQTIIGITSKSTLTLGGKKLS